MPELHSVTRVGNQKSIRPGLEIKKGKISAVRELLEQPLCIPALQLGDSTQVSINDKIDLLGFPGNTMSTSICVSSGPVVQFHEGHIVLSAYQENGQSGGPAISRSGRVIGILSKGLYAAHIVRINSILPLLEQAKS